MSEPAEASSATTQIEQFCSMLLRLLMLLLTPESPAAQLYRQFQRRLDAIGNRITALAAQVEAGHTPKRRAAPAARAKQSPMVNRAGKRNPFPREYGWFADEFGLDLGADGVSLLDHIQTPRVQALMAADPRIGDLFRELLYASGWLDEAEPFLPPTRAERARLARAELARAAQALADAEAHSEPTIETQPLAPPAFSHQTSAAPVKPSQRAGMAVPLRRRCQKAHQASADFHADFVALS